MIAGSGMERLFSTLEVRDVATPYGRSRLRLCSTGGRAFYFLPRHGEGHEVPPHRVDFKANLAALKEVGVESLFATGAVGSMTRRFGVGDLGVLGQFIDLSRRHLTFFEERTSHTDMTEPYDPRLRAALRGAARDLGVKITEGLVYVSVDGPRYETAAEIRMFRSMGGDVVGMTGAQEAILANEIGLRYSSLVIATNWAAGMQERVSHDEVVRMVSEKAEVVRRLLERAVEVTASRSRDAGAEGGAGPRDGEE